MTQEEIKQKAHEFIDTRLKENPDWCDCVTGSWIYDAENWFCEILEKEKDITLFTNDEDYYYTDDVKKYVEIFWDEVQDYFKEKYIERYGSRDGKEYLKGTIYDLKQVKKKFEKAVEYLKNHESYSETIYKVPVDQIDETIKYIEVLINQIKLED